MIETNLNVFDSIVIGILALSCLIAFFRGLVREILSLVAWIGAALVTMHYLTPAMAFTKQYFKSEAMAAGAAVIGLYIGALFVFGLINWMIIKGIKQGGEAGMLDNLLGLGFGALRGAFIVSLGFFLLTIALPTDKESAPKWLKESVTRPYVEQGAVMLASASPEYLRDISSLQKKAAEYATRKKEARDEYWEQDTAERHGEDHTYREDATRQLDRVIENNQPAR